jgi:hypothetical protein
MMFPVSSVPNSSGNGGVMQPVARQRLCKYDPYATIKEAVFFVMRYPFLGFVSKTELVHGSYE